MAGTRVRVGGRVRIGVRISAFYSSSHLHPTNSCIPAGQHFTNSQFRTSTTIWTSYSHSPHKMATRRVWVKSEVRVCEVVI